MPERVRLADLVNSMMKDDTSHFQRWRD